MRPVEPAHPVMHTGRHPHIHPPLVSSPKRSILFVCSSVSNWYVEHQEPTFTYDLILSHFILILRLLRWICWHVAGLNYALKDTLETLPPNQSVSLFTCWSICVMICSWPDSPQWTIIKLSEDDSGGFLVLVALKMCVQFLGDYST